MKNKTVIVINEKPEKVLKLLKQNNMEVSFKNAKNTKSKGKTEKKSAPAC